jgi:hypothetical protein
VNGIHPRRTSKSNIYSPAKECEYILIIKLRWFLISRLGTNVLEAPASSISGSWSFQDIIPKLELGNERNALRGL